MKILILEHSNIFVTGLVSILSGHFGHSQVDFLTCQDSGNPEILVGDKPIELIIVGHSLLDIGAYETCITSLRQSVTHSTPVLLIPEYIDAKVLKHLFVHKLIDGITTRNCSENELVLAIETLLSGEVYLGSTNHLHLNSEESVATLKQDNPLYLIKKLTPREKEILDLVIDGKSSTQISSEIFIAIDTVKTHRKNMMRKLGVSNTIELLSYLNAIDYMKGTH